MSYFPEFDPLLLGIALAIGYLGTFLVMAITQILGSSLATEDKLMRVTCLFCCPPIGLLIHMDKPPVRNTPHILWQKGYA